MVLLRHADLTDSPAEPLSGDDIALGILVICHENSGKRRCNRDAVAVFSRWSVGGPGFPRKLDLDR
jgi:hypothetical protein